MESTRSRCLRLGLALVGLSAFATASPCSGQSVFDPYRPEQAPYNAYTEPSMPNNLALPNAAREARQYNDIANGVGLGNRSRYNSFDRYLDEADSNYGSSRRPGVPYYDAYRPQGSATGRTSPGGREADRAFADRQDAAVRLEAKKDRLYRTAIRERDPARRDQYLRELAYLNSARGAAEEIKANLSGASEPSSRTPTRGATDRSARPPLPGSGRTTRPAASSGTADRRPPLPSELPSGDRPSDRPPAASASIPAAPTGPRPAPTATPR